MNETITIDGQDYEVLTTDPESIKHITHARLAGGVVSVEKNKGKRYIAWQYPDGTEDTAWIEKLEFIGIQPLKLIERKPVEFVGEVVRIDGGNYYVDTINVPVTVQPRMKFRCVQITEEQAILKAKGVS